MRHLNKGRKFARNASHRRAMFRNLVTALLEHGRITTTLMKAKELRSFAERTITISLRLGDLLEKAEADRTKEEHMRVINAMRQVGETVQSHEVVRKLFTDVAPKLRGRPGGYTRVVKIGRRAGDATEMAIIEIVPSAKAVQA